MEKQTYNLNFNIELTQTQVDFLVILWDAIQKMNQWELDYQKGLVEMESYESHGLLNYDEKMDMQFISDFINNDESIQWVLDNSNLSEHTKLLFECSETIFLDLMWHETGYIYFSITKTFTEYFPYITKHY